MDYYGLHFTYIFEASGLNTETVNAVLSSELGEIGFESFEEKENGLSAYIPANMYDAKKIEHKLVCFPLSGVMFKQETEVIKDRDWNEEWEKNYFQPIRIEKECIIRASFHAEEPGFKHTLLINPKMAFGTGNHDTTRLMINELLQSNLSGKTILDMGCGTAVLAILARKLGSGKTVAIDIDEWACENAKENMRLNGIEGIDVRLGGAEQIGTAEHFDLILANINRNILLQNMQNYAAALNPEGLLYLSGFYTEDVPILETEIQKQGLKLVNQKESNHWCLLACASRIRI
ncbi:MAG: 50S ribosomal protein L11 methyltransferase [Massilibacteroides sp.]|nr:50S ribosomal protein L11 methyltransferase [Massilibacteroides sp.]MDD3062565.1 50S ribosomal protein L11 methyltransferase [Massilibacteroides sp.]MDD4115123.1 50S ribosomal protein L11 methyltransferase [Massilibacteroides sp.]MDD4659343.1 50S ribosomal protein L11 methyltransferase [Massilibacteroides sp.]